MGSADELVPHVMSKIFEDKFSSMVDCACGLGKWGYLTRVRLGMVGNEAYLVGCDLWLPAVKFCREHRVYDDQVRCDVRALPFREHSFDIVVACEVLEHLSKAEGGRFIEQAERIASRRLAISTPNGEWHQDSTLSNDFQEHKSAWVSNELQKLGFDVTGVGGLSAKRRSTLLRFLGRGKGLPALGSVILALAGILSPKMPRLGTMLVASKTIHS